MRFNIPNEKDMSMDSEQQKQRLIYVQGLAQNATAPRDLGIIERVQGLNSGLSELYVRLSSLIERVDGSGSAGAKSSPLPAAGLSNVLTDAEGSLRGCMELLGQLNAKL
jgi:hypothetical protein